MKASATNASRRSLRTAPRCAAIRAITTTPCGYALMVDEALQQLPAGEFPTHVFVQGGVGGLAAAVCCHLWERLGARRPRFIVVEPVNAACLYESARHGFITPVHGGLETIMA